MLIYKIENKITKDKYIGYDLHGTTGNTIRIIEHFRLLRINKHYNHYLQNAYNKYGEENFTSSIICEYWCITVKELGEYEKYYINLYDSFKNGYNLTEGGDGTSGFWKGRKHSTATKEKQRSVKLGELNPVYNKHWKATEEQKIANSQRQKGHNMGELNPSKRPESRKKISDALTGKPKSEEHKKNLSIAKKGAKGSFLGKHHTEESKEKISSANSGRKRSEEFKDNYRKRRLGTKHTEETKQKMRDSWSRRKTNETIL